MQTNVHSHQVSLTEFLPPHPTSVGLARGISKSPYRHSSNRTTRQDAEIRIYFNFHHFEWNCCPEIFFDRFPRWSNCSLS